jgi:hypothetical protein
VCGNVFCAACSAETVPLRDGHEVNRFRACGACARAARGSPVLQAVIEVSAHEDHAPNEELCVICQQPARVARGVLSRLAVALGLSKEDRVICPCSVCLRPLHAHCSLEFVRHGPPSSGRLSFNFLKCPACRMVRAG